MAETIDWLKLILGIMITGYALYIQYEILAVIGGLIIATSNVEIKLVQKSPSTKAKK